ncbi:cytidylyltransferase domain-containing protein [Gordonia hongkongensis]|uniref:cytidylyltransferase domain-containing protein n=1 Tax=Gordonia hongkongensis TaxID=1701090 RepID=UPI003D73E4EA
MSSDGLSVAALVPIKRSSERVPGKNFRALGDVPMYHHLLQSLRLSRLIDSVVVDTDSDELISSLKTEFPEVIGRRRHDSLGLPDASMDSVLRDAVPNIEAEVIVQLHVTNPFLRAATIDGAVAAFTAGGSRGTLMSVDRIQSRLWAPDGSPINHNPRVMERTQDMAPVFKENSCFYIFRKHEMVTEGVRCIPPISFFPVPFLEAVDIDTEDDFQVATRLHQSGVLAV